MAEEPTVVDRDEQQYVAITAHVPMRRLGEVLSPLAPEVYGWLAARGVAPSGPCFWKYNVIDMSGKLEVEVGVPVASPVPGEGRVAAGVLPGGRYAAVAHVGPPESLEGATRQLLEWAEARGLVWDVTEVNGVERWGARLEEYLDGPDDDIDPAEWTTNLLFRLAG